MAEPRSVRHWSYVTVLSHSERLLTCGCRCNVALPTGKVRIVEYWQYPERSLKSLGWLGGWRIPVAIQETFGYSRYRQHPETSAPRPVGEVLLLSGTGGTGERMRSAGVPHIHEMVNVWDLPAW